jgi:hypothetical protein
LGSEPRTTITIEVERSRLPVIVEKRANGECQMHAEGPLYMQMHLDVQCKDVMSELVPIVLIVGVSRTLRC